MIEKKPFVLLDPALLKPAVIASFTKLSPQVQWRNPVMFVVYVGSILTTPAAVIVRRRILILAAALFISLAFQLSLALCTLPLK